MSRRTWAPARLAAFAGMLLLALMAPKQTLAQVYTFTQLDNNNDPTFNQLLGINNSGTIAGYFGSDMAPNFNPNKGYTLKHPYTQADYTNENFPASFQTQVTAINTSGQTAGFWADAIGDNFGFLKIGGTFTTVNDPNTPTSGTTTNQLLGLNDNNQAVGFYTDANGNDQGFVYNTVTKAFTGISITGATSLTATGINNAGLVSGFYTDGADNTFGFVENVNGTNLKTFEAPGSTNTTFLGVNNSGLVVGSFQDVNGNTDGLIWNASTNGFQVINDPNGVNGTVLNGLNDNGQFVGFYTDANNLTHGLLVTSVPEPGPIALALAGLVVAGFWQRGWLASATVSVWRGRAIA